MFTLQQELVTQDRIHKLFLNLHFNRPSTQNGLSKESKKDYLTKKKGIQKRSSKWEKAFKYGWSNQTNKC